MMHIRPTRGLKGPSYVWSGLHQDGSRLHRSPVDRIDKMASYSTLDARPAFTGHRYVFFSSATFDSSTLNNDLTNTAIYTLKSKLSKNRIHSTNSGETVDNVSNNKIPISLLVTRILQVNPEVLSQKPETQCTTTQGAKMESTSTIAVRVEHSKPVTSRSPKVVAVTSAPAVAPPSKAIVPYLSRSSTVLRAAPNVWNRSPQPSKSAGIVDSQNNSAYKETYEKFRKLGLLKSRMGNCHVGMTSPSGKTKPPPKNVKTTIGEKMAKKMNSVPKKTAVIKSKFLDNDVVLKVQHYYVSQGKEVPEELKSLTRGSSVRSSTTSNRFAELKRRRYQIYPCTSPSSTIFTRNMKKSE